MNSERTRIKICGLTRVQDVDAAVDLGADALGFVFYPQSPRCLTPEAAAELVRRVPPFVTATGLFVNAGRDAVEAVLDRVPLTLLQFHGDESGEDCAGYRVPFVKAARIRPGFDVLEFARRYRHAQGLLLDAFVAGYGGEGKTFDWSLVPPDLEEKIELRVILGGGLNAANVADAIGRVRPFAVDVSSGVEQSKGVKDIGLMRGFVEAVTLADNRAGNRAENRSSSEFFLRR